MKRSMLITALVVALQSGPSLAQTAQAPVADPDARTLVARTAANYKDLKEYAATGTLEVRMISGDRDQNVSATMTMAERRPDLFHARVDAPGFQIVVVSDGDSTWMLMPGPNQYMVREGGFNLQTANNTMPDLIGEFAGLADSVQSASVLRSETLKTEQGENPAWVVEVIYKPRVTASGTDSTRRTIWIDKERHLVLRDVTNAYFSESPSGSPMTIEEKTTFSSLRINEKLEDALFVFTPPEKSERMNPDQVFDPEDSDHSGELALDFSLKSLEGKAVTLKEQRGKVVLLNFWATWCGPCRVEMPVIEKLHQEYVDKGLSILAIDIDESADDVQAFITENKFSFPILLDVGGAVASKYQATGIPMSLVIDRDGKIIYQFTGARTEAELRAALKDAGLQID